MGRRREEAPKPGEQPPAERVREDFRWVYEQMGGREALLRWAEENAKEFFRSFLSLVQKPGESDADHGDVLRALRELAEEEGE